MLNKSQIKLIRSLQQKKYRNEHGLFFVEGKKTVLELLSSTIAPYHIFTTFTDTFDLPSHLLSYISKAELKQISYLKNPSGVLGVFYIPEASKISFSDWVIALDDVRDPGNLGTIIRLCDWFGIAQLVCSKKTVDCYNPKVLQATMGSITRVNIKYVDLETVLKDCLSPIYGAFMGKKSVYKTQFPKKGVLVLGNEANGISNEVSALITKKISIPQFGAETAESLNVATATAILLSELCRG